jgi:uncharacterized protein (DUF362 family)
MRSKVALLETGGDVNKALKKALGLLGGIDDINTKEKDVVIKVGIFNPKTPHHTSPEIVEAMAKNLGKAPHIYVAESDNYRGKAHERLSIYKKIYSKRITPFNLSDDPETEEVRIAGEKLNFSRILFKPHILVSTHVLRSLEFRGSSWGSVVKNLLGFVPDDKKARFHKRLPEMLFDAYEVVGGIDLAVMDGTYAHLDFNSKKKIKTDLLIVGRDAVAVDAVGAHLLGIDSKKMPVLREAKKRKIGTWDIGEIDIVGESLEDITTRIQKLMSKKLKSSRQRKAKAKNQA